MSEHVPARSTPPVEDSSLGLVPAYLSEEVGARFVLVREDDVCPFCKGVKERGPLACFSCYGAELLRDCGSAELAILEERERELSPMVPPAEPPAAWAAEEELPPPPPYQCEVRGPRVTTARLLMMSVCCGVLLFVVVISTLFFVFSSPSPRLVVVRGPFEEEVGAVVSEPEPPDGVLYEDRRTAALLFVKMLFDVDPETRERDVKDAARMMAPQAADEFVRTLGASGQLAAERRAGMRAWWKRESVEFAGVGGMGVKLTGYQVVERRVSGAAEPLREHVPMTITVRLAVDPGGRRPENQGTGLRVVTFSVERGGELR